MVQSQPPESNPDRDRAPLPPSNPFPKEELPLLDSHCKTEPLREAEIAPQRTCPIWLPYALFSMVLGLAIIMGVAATISFHSLTDPGFVIRKPDPPEKPEAPSQVTFSPQRTLIAIVVSCTFVSILMVRRLESE